MTQQTKVGLQLSRRSNRLVVILSGSGDVTDIAVEELLVRLKDLLKEAHHEVCSVEFRVGEEVQVASSFLGMLTTIYSTLKLHPDLGPGNQKNAVRVFCAEKSSLRDMLGTTRLENYFNVNPSD